MTAQNETPLKVIQITDTHIRSRPGSRLWGVDVDQSLNAVLERVLKVHWPADLILLTGDLVQDEGAAAYQRLHEFMQPFQVPVYCLPGNHDDPAVMAETLPSGQIRYQRHAIHGVWQFIFLDSSLRGTPAGHLGEAELRYLDDALSAHPEQHAMVCLHHHPVKVNTPWLDTMVVDDSDDFFAVLGKHSQVRAVIWGHIHHSFARKDGDIQLFATPSTCVQFKPGSVSAQDDEISPGYRWFDLYPDGSLLTEVERVDYRISPIGELRLN